MLNRDKEIPRIERDFIELREEMSEQMALGLPYLTSVLMRNSARKCLHFQALYYQIEKSTKVWWPVVGWFHYYFLDYKLDTFSPDFLGVKSDRLTKALANSSYPAPDTFEDSISDALRQSFKLNDWMRNRNLDAIIDTVSLAMLKTANVYKVSDMMTLGTFQNEIPDDMRQMVKVGFIPFLNYMLDNNHIDQASKDVSLPIGFANIVKVKGRVKL